MTESPQETIPDPSKTAFSFRDAKVGSHPESGLPPLHSGDIASAEHGVAVQEADVSLQAGQLGHETLSTEEATVAAAPSEGEAPSQDSMKDLHSEVGETLRHGPRITINLMRHGEPYRPGVVPENPEEAARLGKLTDRGVEQAKASADQKAREALASGKPTTFFFLGSPSPYFIKGVPYAQRSMETAQVARQTVEEVIAEKGLSPEQADVHNFGTEIEGARPAPRVGEPDFYHVYGSEKPRAYGEAVRALAAEEGAIERLGAPGHLEPWLRSEPSLEDLRKEVGAQSAPEVAARVMKFMGTLERYATLYAKEHPDRELVFFVASHGEIMRTVMQHGFGAEGAAAAGEEKVYDMAEVMPITVENYKATTEFNGNTYEVDV